MPKKHYTKADVQFHSDRGPSRPAVNVKNYRGTQSVTLPVSLGRMCDCKKHLNMPGKHTWAESFTDPLFTHDWISEHLSDDVVQSYWDFACQQGWEMLGDDAAEIWGPDVRVYSEGRSSGWAVVEGLRDFELWNALDLAKWAKFEKYAQAVAEDIPYQTVMGIYLNEFEPWKEQQDQEEREIKCDLSAQAEVVGMEG